MTELGEGARSTSANSSCCPRFGAPRNVATTARARSYPVGARSELRTMPTTQTGVRERAHIQRARARPKLQEPLTLAAMSLGYAVVQLDVTIVNVAVNSIGAAF